MGLTELPIRVPNGNL